jgi:ABC-2 type transport system ATP-binding protein
MRVALTFGMLISITACAAVPPANEVRASGHVEATEVRLAPEGGGRIVELAVKEGDSVERLTIDQNIQFFGGVYGLRGRAFQERRAFVLEMAGLEGRERTRTSDLAGGWRQRLPLGAPFFTSPRLCSSTSPREGLIRSRAAASGTSSEVCRAAAPPYS